MVRFANDPYIRLARRRRRAQQIKGILIVSAVIGGLAALLMLAGGCAKAQAPDTTPAARDQATRIEVLVERAGSSVEKAVPHTDRIGKVHLADATETLDLSGEAAVQLRAELDRVAAERQELQARADELQARVDDVNGWWIGPRGHYWWGVVKVLWWALLIAAIAATVIGLTGGGLIRKVLAYGGRFWLGSVVPGGGLLIWLADAVWRKKEIAAVTESAAADNEAKINAELVKRLTRSGRVQDGSGGGLGQ